MIRTLPVSIVAFAAAIVTILLYLPVLKYGFVHIDDPAYVQNNPLITSLNLDTVLSAFSRSHVGWWMPLTWLSFAVDYHFWKLNPFGYHLTNILLHAVNSALVVFIADQACKVRGEDGERAIRPGYFYPGILLVAGLCFGTHPLRVESVAWITERKDVLNGIFCFASILFYLLFVEQKGNTSGKSRAALYYQLSLLCFVSSLMAKSTSVVLPVMLLVLDWSPLGRFDRKNVRTVLLEKVPYFVAAVLVTVFTLSIASQNQYLVTYESFPFTQRLAVSGNAIWEYCRLLLYPAGLSPFNIIPDPVPVVYTMKAFLVVIAAAWILFAGISTRYKACLLFFILPLLPVLAFFQNGDQSYADRFTYLPSLSIVIFFTIFLVDRASLVGTRREVLILLVAVPVVFFFMFTTARQLAVWESTETYWTRVIDIEPLAISYKERGRYYHLIGRYDAAVADFNSAIERVTTTLKPYEYNLYAYRAESLQCADHNDLAVIDFTKAIAGLPHPAYFFHRGLALRALGRAKDADDDFRRAGPNPGQIGWFDKGI